MRMNVFWEDMPNEELYLDRPIIKASDNYTELHNLPSINGISLIGDLSGGDLGLQDICYGTTAHWASQTGFIPAAGQIVIYTDKTVTEDEEGNQTVIPGIKIGDGMAYCVDLPFVGDDSAAEILDEIKAHLRNSDIHVSSADRLRWDNKVSVRLSEDGEEIIEFYRE